jgi:hypothetical protein
MADPLDLTDLDGHTGAGCAHDKERAVLQALRDWRTAPATVTALGNLKTALESACPGVTWTNAKILRALRRWVEEA